MVRLKNHLFRVCHLYLHPRQRFIEQRRFPPHQLMFPLPEFKLALEPGQFSGRIREDPPSLCGFLPG
ncbi:MAG: hypothetical protein ABL974_02095 [Prosthecobacter sp.]